MSTGRPGGRRRAWPDRVPRIALGWAVGYALVQLFWAFTGTAVPWSSAVGYPPSVLWLLGGLGAVAAAACLAVVRGSRGRGSGLVTAGLVVPVLAVAVGMIGLPAHLVTLAADAGVDSPAALAQVLLSTAGVCLLVPTAVVHRRRARGVCSRCGRRHAGEGVLRHPAPTRAPGGTRLAVYLLLLGPVPWAATKTVWLLGGDALGVTAEGWSRANESEPPVVRMLSDAGIDVTVLAAAAAALLSAALLHTWGQRVPRWMPVLAGRRVPPLLLLLPAALCGGALALYGSFLVVYAPLAGSGVLPVPEIAEPFTSVAGATWMTFFGGLAFGGLGFALLIGARSYLARTRPWCDLSETGYRAGAARVDAG